MSRIDKVNELIAKRSGEESVGRTRLEKIFDENSFVELGACNEAAGVVTGFGTVDGRLVYGYCQESAVNTAHARKVENIYSLALKMGAPVVGILDSAGVVLEDGMDAFEAYGLLFKNQTMASGIVPQISIVVGDCIGVESFVPVLSDFVFMTEEKAKMFMTSPSAFKGLEGKATTYQELGGGKVHSESTGLVHCCCADEQECFAQARKLISILPENNMDIPVDEITDDLNREDESLNTIVPEDNSEIDVHYIISSVADNNDFFEIHKDYAKNIVVGFVKLNGITTGVVANNGLLNVSATQKAGEFVNFCDAFNIPILTLTDAMGYEKTIEDEHKVIEKYGAKLMYSFANATVPKINVIIRNGIGNAYLLMNSKHIGADVVYAWPFASIALMDKDSSVNVLKMSADEYEKNASPYAVASKGYVDGVIIPASTRKRILAAIEMLMSKREPQASRKHSSIEF